MLPMVVAGDCVLRFPSPLVFEAFKIAGHAGGGADADWRRFGVCADSAGTGRLYRFLHLGSRRGLTPGLIGGMLAVSTGSGFIGGIIAGFLAGYMAKLIGTKLSTSAKYGSAEANLIIPLISVWWWGWR